MSFRLVLADFLHTLAHAIGPSRYECNCYLVAYQKSWRARREADEKRARLLREEGVPGGLLEQARREGRM